MFVVSFLTLSQTVELYQRFATYRQHHIFDLSEYIANDDKENQHFGKYRRTYLASAKLSEHKSDACAETIAVLNDHQL